MDHLRLRSGAEMTEIVCARSAFLWMLKSWHSWLAQYKYGHPSAVPLLEFICRIAVMWFLWQLSDSLNWKKTMASFSGAAVWGPALWKNPNTPWPRESTWACTPLSACGNISAWRFPALELASVLPACRAIARPDLGTDFPVLPLKTQTISHKSNERKRQHIYIKLALGWVCLCFVSKDWTGHISN